MVFSFTEDARSLAHQMATIQILPDLMKPYLSDFCFKIRFNPASPLESSLITCWFQGNDCPQRRKSLLERRLT